MKQIQKYASYAERKFTNGNTWSISYLILTYIRNAGNQSRLDAD
ncbi:MAG: hypothetical protein AMDU5_GPLC00001G0132 [Thermoplasmatales archaeon Gpl]|nr:MAG: hypothetical protein AMDU5_GPLC00001G0132 [Thermoplasmatales archaeon Gpl]